MSKFSETIRISIKMLKDPQRLLDSELFDSAAESIGVVIKLLEDLQPPRPTCSTCNHIRKQSGNHWCMKILNSKTYIGHINIDEFGCINHSDYEMNDANK